MTQEQILSSSFSKTKKACLLYELGLTRNQVAGLVTNGNYGFAHNIWKKWNEVRNGIVTDEPYSNQPFDFEFNRTFGIELEIYDASRDRLIAAFRNEGLVLVGEDYNHSTRTHWKIVRDSSIQGLNGNEIVSPILCGLDGIEQLKKVTIALNKAGAKINTSCGFHVHFGITDLSIDNIKTLAKNHMELENAFDSIVPSSRRLNNNTYCKSLTSVAATKSVVISRLNAATSITDIKQLFHTRYLKMNFQSYDRQGTVEFRQHSGTTTFSKIKNWVLICARLVEFSKQNGLTNNINKILNESLQDYFNDRAVDLAA